MLNQEMNTIEETKLEDTKKEQVSEEEFVAIEQIQKGIANYVDKYLLPQMTGAERVGKGILLSILIKKLPLYINNIAANHVVNSLGIIKDNQIDIRILIETTTEQLNKQGTVTINVPIIGTLTLDREAVEQLYQEIKQAR